jgi:hypothetical protein
MGALALYGLLVGSYGFSEGRVPGLAGLSPLAALCPLLGINDARVTTARAILFGSPSPRVLISLLL